MFKNITSALIACGLVTPVWAATDAIFDDPFFTDSQLTVSAKNYWKYLKEENANPKHVHNAWGQGFSAEYQSGYFADIIGFDVSYYSAIKLGASDYFNSRGVLYNNGTEMGIGYTNAKKAGEVGFYPRHMSKNSRGTFISMAYAGDDYMRDGELVLANITEYRLTPELAIGLAGNIGQFNYKGNHVRTGEINAFSRWVPTQSMFKNFTFWAMFGPGWSYKTQGKTPVLTDGHYTRTNTLSSEVIMEYRFKVF
ncbi:OprD family outer membrane porin [Klebsiella aerogenes]|nr:OprD family outer membrane porin [Klebsiella aerogenes]